jgi:hypothetical protein
VGIELRMDEYGFRSLAAIPILILGIYVYKSNARELSNRVFALFCLLWTMFIVSVNFVSLSNTIDSAQLFNRMSVYSGLLLIPLLVHFVLIFPYRSSILKHRWLLPVAYASALLALAATFLREDILVRFPSTDSTTLVYSPEARPALYFYLTLAFTLAVVLLILRYTLTDLEVTRKRLFFVTFAIATYALYDAIDSVHINRDEDFLASFVGEDDTYWRLTMATNALLILTYFSILVLLAIRTSHAERRRESWLLVGFGFLAVVSGYFDPIARHFWPDYPGTLWLWRISGVSLIFYAILRYQLFDLNVRIRIGVRYGTLATIFFFVFFTVQELVKDVWGQAFGYFTGLLLAGALIFLFTPLQGYIEKFSHRLVPASTSETYERYRAMEIYRAALEGALADRVVNSTELATLKNLRATLGITDTDHQLLERDIRARLVQGGV